MCIILSDAKPSSLGRTKAGEERCYLTVLSGSDTHWMWFFPTSLPIAEHISHLAVLSLVISKWSFFIYSFGTYFLCNSMCQELGNSTVNSTVSWWFKQETNTSSPSPLPSSHAYHFLPCSQCVRFLFMDLTWRICIHVTYSTPVKCCCIFLWYAFSPSFKCL